MGISHIVLATKRIVLLVLITITFGLAATAHAIIFGEPDVNLEYPNVAFVRGITESTPPIASFNCSGSLLYIDADKVVILTANHCTEIWQEEIAAGRLDTVGVSFDQDNLADAQNFPGLTRYVRGGIPISLPDKHNPFERLDYGLVVFSTADQNPAGQTINDRWGNIPGALTPVQIPPTLDYVTNLLASAQTDKKSLLFTAVGYGTGERFPIPSQEQGPANPNDPNNATLRIRNIADHLTYNAYNPSNDVLRLSQNSALGNNGTCTADSGGPIFIENAQLGRIQVSLVSGGDNVCRSTNTGPGFSRSEAFDFLECATVPGDASAVIACVEARFGTTP